MYLVLQDPDHYETNIIDRFEEKITAYARCLKEDVRGSKMGCTLNKQGSELFNYPLHSFICHVPPQMRWLWIKSKKTVTWGLTVLKVTERYAIKL